MKSSKINLIAVNAMIAAVYAALTLLLAPISYGEIQCRVAEVLVFLAFYNKKYFPGLIIGCAIANLASPMLAYDMFFGVGATIIACFGMYYAKNLYLGAFLGALANGILVGLELNLAFGAPLLMTMLYVFIGEFIVLVIGAIIWKSIQNNPKIQEYLNA